MRIRIFALVAMLSLALATSAVAQTPDQDAYGGFAGQEQADTGGLGNSGASNGTAPVSNTATPTETGSSSGAGGGSLPFTGLQAGLILALGVGLVGTGVAVRRASRRGAQA